MKAVCVRLLTALVVRVIVMGHARGLAGSIRPNNNAFKIGY